MRRTFFIKLVVSLTLALTSVMLADVYDHSGRPGDFQDGQWINQTTSPPRGPFIYGNPGAGDDAYFYGTSLTASSGSVHLLSGDNLSLSGMLTATNVGRLTLSGGGTLNVQAIVTDANGFGPILSVAGAHVSAQNGDGVTDVTAGGTVVDATCSGTNGCGFFDGGSSLTITGAAGPGRAILAHASMLTANGGLQNFVLQIQSGSTGQVSTVTNGQAMVDGAGSVLTVAGDFSLNPQALQVSNGGVLNVTGGLTQSAGSPALINGSQSALTVGQDLSLANGFQITAGGAVTVQGSVAQTRGSILLDGSGSALTVFKDLSVMAGFLDISAGAALTVKGDLALDGGTDRSTGRPIGGGGHWTGMGTRITSSQNMYVGNTTGTFSLAIDGGAFLDVADVLIGRGAPGSVTLSGAGTTLKVRTGMALAGRGGRLDISDGANLLFDDGTLFGIGFGSSLTARLTVDGNNSLVDATNALVSIGKLANSSGVASLTNGARFFVGEDFIVGDDGNGNLTASSASKVAVNRTTARFLLGNVAKSSGSASVRNTDSLISATGPVIVGVAGTGFLGAGQGGSLSFTNPGELIVAQMPDAKGTIVLDGVDSSLTTAGPVILGDQGTGILTISNGAKLNLPTDDEIHLTVGNKAKSSGTVTVDASTFLDNLSVIIGQAGTGSFNAMNRSTVLLLTFASGRSPGGQGSVTIDNSDWGATGGAYIGSTLSSNPLSTVSVRNNGTMLVGGVMFVHRSGLVTIDSSSKVAVGSGDFGPAGSLRVSVPGFLSGYGRVQGQVIVASGGRIAPGDSPGVFTVEGSYQQESGGTYFAEIGGTDAGGYDQINVTGAATLGGNLNVRLVNGFTPAVGQTFRIVSAGSVSGAFTSVSQPSQAGINLTSDATGVTVTITSVVAGAPVISSATSASTVPGAPFDYQVTATNNPTSFGATNLPAGLTVDNNTGLISGTPTTAGVFVIPINANNAAGSGQADLILGVDPTFITPPLGGKLLNISTRLRVQTGDNALIGGFIVTGAVAKKVIIRAIGPSLALSGVNGALADPMLELHGSDGSLIVANDNWKETQEAEITATGIAPKSDLESAIVRTLAPGSYTAILRGKNDGTGIGLVEAYDLEQAANSTLANISTRGFVETGDNVLIGGFIVGGGSGGFARVVVRAIGPSLATSGVQGALQDPTLELRDQNGGLITANDNWKDVQQAEISALGLAPKNDAESAIVASLPPGNTTATVRGKDGTTGVGLVEVYNVP